MNRHPHQWQHQSAGPPHRSSQRRRTVMCGCRRAWERQSPAPSHRPVQHQRTTTCGRQELSLSHLRLTTTCGRQKPSRPWRRCRAAASRHQSSAVHRRSPSRGPPPALRYRPHGAASLRPSTALLPSRRSTCRAPASRHRQETTRMPGDGECARPTACTISVRHPGPSWCSCCLHQTLPSMATK